jgi:hypothetical protein
LHTVPVPVKLKKYVLRQLFGRDPISQKMPADAEYHGFVGLYGLAKARQIRIPFLRI